MAKQPIARCIGYIPVSGSTYFEEGKIIPRRPVFEANVDYVIEVIAEDLDGIASVSVEIEDGTNTVTKTATAETLSMYIPEVYQPNGEGSGREAVYAVTFSASELNTINDGVVDINFTVTDNNLGTTTTWTEKGINDQGSVMTVHTLYVDSVNGNNSNDGLSMINAKADLTLAIESVGGTLAGDTDLVICKMAAGTYNFSSSVFPYLYGENWTIIEPDTGVDRSSVIYNKGSGAVQHRLRFMCFRNTTILVDDATTGGTAQFDGWSVHTDDEFWFDKCVWTHSLGITGQLTSAGTALFSRVNVGDRVSFTRCDIGDMIEDVKVPGWVRDCYIHDTFGDGLRDPFYAVQVHLENLSVPPELIRVNSTTGATVGGIIYGVNTTSQATILEVNTNYSVIIDTSGGVDSADFKAEEQIANAIEYYAAGETPTVDTPAGTATHVPPHPDGIQNVGGVDSQVVSNIWFENIDGQVIFCDAVSVVQENCLRRNIFGNQTASYASLSQMGQNVTGGTLNHIIYHNITLVNQKFFARTEPVNTYSNVLFKHCVFADFGGDIPSSDGTANGITITDCHATDPAALYTTSRGDPGLVNAPSYNDVSIGSYDLRPDTGSVLFNMLGTNERLSLLDAYGIAVLNDGTGAIGALQGVPASLNPSAAPEGNTGIYTYDGESKIYLVYDSNITYTGSSPHPITITNGSGSTETVTSVTTSGNVVTIEFTGDIPQLGDSNWTITLDNSSGRLTTNSNSVAVASFTNLGVGIAPPPYANNTPTLNAFIGGDSFYVDFTDPVIFTEIDSSWLTVVYNGITLSSPTNISGSETDRLIVEYNSLKFSPNSTLSVSWNNESIQDVNTNLLLGATTLTATLGTLIFGTQNTEAVKIARFRNPGPYNPDV